MHSGAAKSRDGKWTGVINAIPAKYKDNWQRNITFIRYGVGGSCSYFMGLTDAIDLEYEQFPYGYTLYDYTEGTNSIYDHPCWYDRLAGPITATPSRTNPCYFADHPYE